MRKPRIITLVVLIAMLVTLLPACGPTATQAPAANEPAANEPAANEPAANEPAATKPAANEPAASEPEIAPGELEIGVLWEEGAPSYDLVKGIGDTIIADYPGTEITYTFNNTAGRQGIEARMIAGDPIDADLIFEGMDPNTFEWVKNDYILDITEAMTTPRADGTKWVDDFNPLFLPSMKYEDKYYAAAQEVYIWLLHYNKKLFDKWGLTPPETWDDLLSMCETIKESGDGVAPIAVTGQVNFYVGMWFDELTQRLAGTDKVMEYLYGDTDMKMADDPAFLQAAKEMMKLKDNGCLIEGWEGTDFTTTQVYFFQDKAAMILMGSWLMTEMKASIPEGFELAVAPFPTVEGGKGKQDAIFGRAVSWSIPAKTDNPELAIEYLRRFTSKDAAVKRVEQLGSVPALVGVSAPTDINGINDVLENAKTAEFVMYNYGLGAAKFGLMSAWYDPLVEMWLGKLTPEEAIAKIDANVTAVRDQRKAAE